MKADIIIFSGQSNMQGQAELLADPSVVENAYEYKYAKDALVPLRDPFGEDLTYEGKEGLQYHDGLAGCWHGMHVFGSAAYGFSTLVPSFCRTYTELTGRAVIAVGAAKGSTTIRYWMPGTDAFGFIGKKLGGARRAASELFDIAGTYFVWYQGESDAIESTGRDEYKGLLSRLGHALHDGLGVDRFGLIRCGYFTEDERDLEIIGAQDDICGEDPYFVMLTDEITKLNSMPEYMNPYVKGHLGARGLAKVGRDSAAALVSAIK